MENFEKIITESLDEINLIDSFNNLEIIKAKYLGKSGIITNFMKHLKQLSLEEKKSYGAFINAQKNIFLEKLHNKKKELDNIELHKKLSSQSIDVTLPGKGETLGALHPITLTTLRIIKLFQSIGFDIATGPEIENDFYNFTALNIPKNHPARNMQDTFYIENGDVLRTHTSNIQIRYMLDKKHPPFKIIAPGRTYRVDSDATHSPMFHQAEGLWVEQGINFVDLKSIISDFLYKFFENNNLKIRFRPSFFPFTEPSAEIDIAWGEKWLEVGGCGIVHPNVLTNVNIDPTYYTGLAFGIGIDRYAMLNYQIQDLRCFFENDLSFLQQFS